MLSNVLHACAYMYIVNLIPDLFGVILYIFNLNIGLLSCHNSCIWLRFIYCGLSLLCFTCGCITTFFLSFMKSIICHMRLFYFDTKLYVAASKHEWHDLKQSVTSARFKTIGDICSMLSNYLRVVSISGSPCLIFINDPI